MFEIIKPKTVSNICFDNNNSFSIFNVFLTDIFFLNNFLKKGTF
jgi:hypothetical protein